MYVRNWFTVERWIKIQADFALFVLFIYLFDNDNDVKKAIEITRTKAEKYAKHVKCQKGAKAELGQHWLAPKQSTKTLQNSKN